MDHWGNKFATYEVRQDVTRGKGRGGSSGIMICWNFLWHVSALRDGEGCEYIEPLSDIAMIVLPLTIHSIIHSLPLLPSKWQLFFSFFSLAFLINSCFDSLPCLLRFGAIRTLQTTSSILIIKTELSPSCLCHTWRLSSSTFMYQST